ncbi:sin3 protein [Mucor ambiguus]|uniref:Sin3 protein n=1 Tax=Mucor ambiguus TaxID=91626 RepID=A0A0C9LVW2_9FUNG|nr:sin3 protein [Mucor ambiguus]
MIHTLPRSFVCGLLVNIHTPLSPRKRSNSKVIAHLRSPSPSLFLPSALYFTLNTAMSSPIQPPPNIRSPSVGSQPSSQPTSGSVPPATTTAPAPTVPSPYSHHLPPPSNLAQSGGSPSIASQQQQQQHQPSPSAAQSMSTSLPPPPTSRVTELPSILSPPRNSASPSFTNHHTLPPTGSLSNSNDHANGPSTVLPPIPSRTATPTFNERRPSIVRQPIQQQQSSPAQQHHQPHSQSSSQHPQQSTSNNASFTATATSPSSSSQGGGYRPLNVRDALTYLDQVKVRFSDDPDVYNQFLDIMKDFKSQAIDTPGVIERVSTLFKGHPTLISGFNTFLPPGYRIECSTDPREPDLITVTTPSGVTTTTGGSANRMNMEAENSASMHGHPQQHHQHQPPPPQSYYPYGHMHQPPPPPPPPSAMHHPPHQGASSGHSMHSIPPPPPPQQSHPQSMMSQSIYQQPPPPPSQHNRAPVPPPLHHSPTQPSAPTEKRSPVEFNHAINYVNKIKNRFSGDPEVYKQFLEILQTYQKDQKPIQEVYAHVQFLFNGAPDLLDEFKQFLPDITGQPASVLFDSISPSYYSGSKRSAIDNAPSNSMLPPGKKKRVNNTQSKKSKLYKENGDIMSNNMRDPYSYPNSPFDPVRPSVSTEEIELFDRIRKHIGNKPSYEEFLKTLNLYTQQILDLNTLVEQVGIFIGNNKELFDWFKSIVGYEPRDHPIEKPVNPIPKPDLAHCKTTADSPSYRCVPKNWQNQPCSGRDQIAWEVLNDEFVSHPIWASEDDGFVASKKSQYEEAMHRCEEERYDYNMNIEANLNVIALLEPIAHRIEAMSMEERANFKLRPGLGGQSVTIYERIIKKVYDKERGMEIIELLYSSPAQVIPILLKRLKQKDEEWKRAQREWNKIWRELDAKNFYRALDYQGITFKSNDRKAMAPKALVSEIENLQHEKKMKEGGSDKAMHSKESYQFKFAFNDNGIFKDVTRVIYSFIDRQTGYTSSDREKIRTFIQTFIPLCFQLEDVVPEGMSLYADEVEEDDLAEDDDDNNSTNTEESESDVARSPRKRSQSPSRRRSGRSRNHHEDEHTMDLLRDVLTKNQNALDESSLTARSRSPSPFAPVEEVAVVKTELDTTAISTLTDEMPNTTAATMAGSPMQINEEPSGDKLFAAAAAAIAPGVKKRILYSFFCNTTFYCFFRLYEMLYERLSKLHTLDEKMKKHPNMGKRVNKVARDLGLYSSRFDDVNVSKGYYNAILEMIDHFFDGDIDQQVFEEHTRYIFTTDAYLIFTIDKLVHSMVKQIQAITVDPKSVELIRLFRSDKGLESMSPRILSVYRLRAEDIVGSEENLYKLNFDNDARNMTIQLIGKDDYMLEPTAADKYEDYVASYMDWVNTTEGIDASSMKPTFLTRNLRPQDEHLNKIFVRSKLQYKIDQDTYHMYYIVGSEDIFVRPQNANDKQQGDKKSQSTSKWDEWVESSTTGWSKGLDEAKKQLMEDEARNLLS